MLSSSSQEHYSSSTIVFIEKLVRIDCGVAILILIVTEFIVESNYYTTVGFSVNSSMIM